MPRALVATSHVNGWNWLSRAKSRSLVVRTVIPWRGTHRDQGDIGQACLADLLITVLGRQPSQHFASLCPVGQVGHQDAPGPVEVTLEPFHDASAPPGHSGIELFKDYGAQPHRRL